MQEESEATKNMPARTEALRFESQGFFLSGILHLPEAKNPPLDPPVVIGSHGLLSDAHSAKQVELAQSLALSGVAYFRFNHRGSGDSEGDLAETSLNTRVEDLVAAWQMLAARKDIGRAFGLFGSSMGAATCIAAWSAIQPAATFLVAPLINGRVLRQQNPETIKDILTETGLPESFFRENVNFELGECIPAMHTVFVVHGTDDEVVPVAEGRRVYELAAEPKRFIAFEGGDHRVSHPAHQHILLKEALEFFEDTLICKGTSCDL